ncbi:MAG: PTS sugar transporter subunit IIA [Cardiobacteriaceae bacterium]|nr:PTS sugar transporter subunit IIA [Cardiobacteriaceae bacterium]
MRLTPDLISLDRPPTDKMSAIAQAAELLTRAGCVEEPFRYGMIAREATSNTYLGHGIALPHSAEQTERHIRNAGLAVIRAPAGIPWGPNAEKADTIIAIAATHDGYLAILDHITTLIAREDALARLKNTREPQDIITFLTLPDKDNDNLPATSDNNIAPSDADEPQRHLAENTTSDDNAKAPDTLIVAHEHEENAEIIEPFGKHSAAISDTDHGEALVQPDNSSNSSSPAAALTTPDKNSNSEPRLQNPPPENSSSPQTPREPASHNPIWGIIAYVSAALLLFGIAYWLSH